MYRFRGVRCLLGAVIAVLVGCAVPAAASPVPAPVPVPVSAPAASAYVAHAVASAERGPSCDPGTRDRGQAPGVPPRGAGEHAHAPVGRAAGDQVWADRTPAAPVLVRGPDQPAPGPVELSVMRV
ncbi:hypothetical protein [Streptomyces vinaceus]|uniref:hypothetical protein n=1 Tax=Streptomyces vinaceus TaxID=1960 RepID=UPI00382939E4